MTTSIVIPYRNRLAHLQLLIPRLRLLFPTEEIVVVEQMGTGKFRKPVLLNVGALHTNGTQLILHDVDYVPDTDAVYYEDGYDVYLPVRSAQFVYNDFTPKPIEEVPGGYRHFLTGVDDDFFGGALTFQRDAFYKINGSNTLYVGWGFEDKDLYNRCIYYGLKMKRHVGNHFLVLDHADSGPPFTDQDFIDNINRSQRTRDFLNFGLDTTHPTVVETTVQVPGVTRWLEVSDMNGPTNIVASTFNWEEGDE